MPQVMLMDYLVLLSYISSQLFFKIKTFAGLSYVLLNWIIIVFAYKLYVFAYPPILK